MAIDMTKIHPVAIALNAKTEADPEMVQYSITTQVITQVALADASGNVVFEYEREADNAMSQEEFQKKLNEVLANYDTMFFIPSSDSYKTTDLKDVLKGKSDIDGGKTVGILTSENCIRFGLMKAHVSEVKPEQKTKFRNLLDVAKKVIDQNISLYEVFKYYYDYDEESIKMMMLNAKSRALLTIQLWKTLYGIE